MKAFAGSVAMVVTFLFPCFTHNGGAQFKTSPLPWNPPILDTPVRSSIATPPCALDDALAKASIRARAFAANVQKIAAVENVQYADLASRGDLVSNGSGTYDYVVEMKKSPRGFAAEESRSPRRGSTLSPEVQDQGLSDVALIFHPEMRDDYEFKCEATVAWKHHPAWVIHFEQKEGRPARTLSFPSPKGPLPAPLKGRAWIAADSGEILHLETGLVQGMPAAQVRRWYLSVSYAPVQFRSKNVQLWLPQSAEVYCEFETYRSVVYHTFTDFVLSSVEIQQERPKPGNP